jgi:uncharacterized protein (TIGR02145 family)
MIIMEIRKIIWLIITLPVLGGIILAIALSNSCKKEVMLPIVGPVEITNLTETSLEGNTRIHWDGGDDITERGICWSTDLLPTIADNKTSDGHGAGSFSSSVTGLSNTTLYHVRGYATNSQGTAYGELVTIHTWSGTMKDIDNNSYYTITIGSQEWMGQNLRVKRLNDGTELFFGKTTSPLASYWYPGTGGGLFFNSPTYGAFYNGYAVLEGKLCPKGWHMPAESDWLELIDHLGGYTKAGAKMKESGYTHWDRPNKGATNESGFTGIPSGYSNYSTGGGCEGDVSENLQNYGDGLYAYFWSSARNIKDFRNDTVFYVAILTYDSTGAYPGNGFPKDGRSVRCVRDR